MKPASVRLIVPARNPVFGCSPTNTNIPPMTFSQLESAAQSPEQRSYYEGRLVQILGRYQGTSDEFFTLTRYKINCCAADAQPIKAITRLAPGVSQKLPYAQLNGKWV